MRNERVRPKILVAEDDEAVLDLLTTRLELAGYWVVGAQNGLRALQAIRETRPAGVLLDVNMPLMDGFEVLATLKHGGDRERVPVLMLTARNAADDVLKAISLGARDYVTKPFDDAQLLARVARLIRNARPVQPVTVI